MGESLGQANICGCGRRAERRPRVRLGPLPERAGPVYSEYLSRRASRLNLAIASMLKDEACAQGMGLELGSDLTPGEPLRFCSLCRSVG